MISSVIYRYCAVILCLSHVFVSISFANTESKDDLLFDEQQFIEITKELKCLTCNGESVYDSKSDFSNGIKNIIQKKLSSNHNKQEIIQYFIKIYGEEILLKPFFSWHNIILWCTPFFILLYGIYQIFCNNLKKRK